MGCPILSSFLRGWRFDGRSAERSAAKARIWEALPTESQAIRHQWLGTMSSGCAATQGIHEACDFSCTACYLPSTANKTPAMPLADAKAQLDAIRRHTGPGGNCQLTAGEVTLLPKAHLAALVRHARALELDPMVMTHGQTFERDPSYLHALMEAGLEKVAVHVDETQRGRDGVSSKPKEQDLFVVRERMAKVIRDARTRTGRPLYASHTVTVSERNIDVVPDIVRWTLKNADAFRMLSLQPVAAVGRTRVGRIADGEHVWNKVEDGAGTSLNPHTFTLGHPACNRVCLTFVVRFGDEVRLVEVRREDKAIDAFFFDGLIQGRFQDFYTDGADGLELAGRCFGLLRREPKYLAQWPLYAVYRAVEHLPWAPRFLAALARGEHCFIRPFVAVVHNFMSTDELDTDEGRLRLDACSFKVPVDGNMVSMCELNGSDLRKSLNEKLISLGQKAAS